MSSPSLCSFSDSNLVVSRRPGLLPMDDDEMSAGMASDSAGEDMDLF